MKAWCGNERRGVHLTGCLRYDNRQRVNINEVALTGTTGLLGRQEGI